MSRNLSANADLANKYAVGEILDMLGVPEFYDAGTSKWMQGGVWFPQSTLGAAIATAFASSSSEFVSVSGTQSEAINAQAMVGAYLPPAKLGNSFIFTSTNRGYALLINDAGWKRITLPTANVGSRGASVISDGTYFWATEINTTVNAPVYRSTDGETWTEFTTSGQPSWSSYWLFPSSSNASFPNVTGSSISYISYSDGTEGSTQNIQAWCGARTVRMGQASSNISVYTTANQTSWTESCTAVLGATTGTVGGASLTIHRFFHKGSGLKAFITPNNISTYARYTLDGGVTWATSAGYAASSSTTWEYNKTNLDALAYNVTLSGSMKVSTDCGATWVSRTIPATRVGYGFAYAGTTMVSTGASGLTTSTDNGATWTNVILPVTGEPYCVRHDGQRFICALTAQRALITSVDGLTWTVRSLPFFPINSDYFVVDSCDSLTTFGHFGNTAFWTLDGGVTWKQAKVAQSFTISASSIRSVTTAAGSFFVIGHNRSQSSDNAVISKSDLVLGGAFFRASTSAPSALRSGTTAMLRAA